MGEKRILVLDTTVLLTAYAGGNAERRIYEACRASRLRMATSPDLLAELERALRYPKFGFLHQDITAVLQDVLSHAIVLEPTRRVDLIPEDPHANRILECALAADANGVVTADPHVLALGVCEEILILPALSILSLLPECP